MCACACLCDHRVICIHPSSITVAMQSESDGAQDGGRPCIICHCHEDTGQEDEHGSGRVKESLGAKGGVEFLILVVACTIQC